MSRGIRFQVSGLTLLLLSCTGADGLAVQDPRCAADNGGLELPPGFCAIVVADEVGRARHLAVAPSGDIFAALRRGRGEGEEGGLLALRDNDGDGRADVMERFGDASATGVWLHGDLLY